jgi:adenine-specific DNA-methyltransferase
MRRVIEEDDSFRDHSVQFHSSLSKETRKDQGIYFTPKKIRDRVFELLHTYAIRPTRILEPSCGSGEFLMDAQLHFPDAECIGVEYNEPLAISARQTSRLRVDQADFLTWHNEKEFPLIIGNPPYVVVKTDDYKECVVGRPNAFVLFLYKCMTVHLAPHGILAFILSTSLYNSSYYQPMRNYLALHSTILALETLVDPGFHGTKQDTMLIMVQKTPSETRPYLFDLSHRWYMSPYASELKDMVRDATTLSDLGLKVKTGSVTWNEVKDHLADEGTVLVYDSNIKEGQFIPGVPLPKKQYVQGIPKPVLDTPVILVARGYGNSYQFKYVYMENTNCYAENHVNVIYPSSPDSIPNLQRVLTSFKDPRTMSFIKRFVGNGQLSATDLETIVPIF